MTELKYSGNLYHYGFRNEQHRDAHERALGITRESKGKSNKREAGVNRKDFRAMQEERVQKRYEEVPQHVRDDVLEALLWARETLMRKEGEGHLFNICGSAADMVVCSFAKPQWGGDHCSRRMDTGSEAVVMAVCEYLEGM